MKARGELALLASIVCSAVIFVCAPVPALSEVSVNINIGPPPVVVEQPPELIVVPRTMVYYAPGVSAELFFYRGRWWTRHDGRWFRSGSYKGPWVVVGPRYVPAEIVRVPGDYRKIYAHEHHIPYGQLKKHWERREYERRRHMGEWREGKRERKEEQREWKEERKELKREHKEHGRGHGRDD
jgi:hypothetical protein